MSKSDFIDLQRHYSAANAAANLTISRENGGQKVSLTFEFTLPYEDGKCVVLPKCCSKCPIGYHKDGTCGRAIPFNEESYEKRPNSCYLEQITLEDLFRTLGLDVKGIIV